jgi:hypothetical protein
MLFDKGLLVSEECLPCGSLEESTISYGLVGGVSLASRADTSQEKLILIRLKKGSTSSDFVTMR